MENTSQGRSSAIGDEIAALDAGNRLLGPRRGADGHTYEVLCARADEIPRSLEEIGRLRAEAFPDAAEDGIELDAFDATYRHLFVWDRDAQRIAGGYRLALTSELGADDDPSRLYTHTLFAFDAELPRRLGNALELGRSFVRADYQARSPVLELLWKGIGRFLARNTDVRHLFGALTIHHDFHAEARALLLDYLGTRAAEDKLRSLVTPRNPVPTRRIEGALRVPIPDTMNELSRRFQELEQTKRFPTLLRHYCRLGARSLGFSADPLFGGSIDALIVMDLHACHPRMLRGYVGADFADAILQAQATPTGR